MTDAWLKPPDTMVKRIEAFYVKHYQKEKSVLFMGAPPGGRLEFSPTKSKGNAMNWKIGAILARQSSQRQSREWSEPCHRDPLQIPSETLPHRSPLQDPQE
jgi:hypothetical protein